MGKPQLTAGMFAILDNEALRAARPIEFDIFATTSQFVYIESIDGDEAHIYLTDLLRTVVPVAWLRLSKFQSEAADGS